jgi:hypothetical protein
MTAVATEPSSSTDLRSQNESNHDDQISQLLNPSLSANAAQFRFSDFLRRQYRFGLDPNRQVCKFFREGHCPLGNDCPDRHVSSAAAGG